ncbi:alpha/beta fold hydrolase [Bacillus sp. S/N-304-OC-R1]|uniref:intracellular short-chain-length polyhydroxyalkanoate depolymerase n=1 Tax=Bacillus sp. S/N-304-OC-R1 TaxID=2758034 RepID=UPI001C8D29A2|nr:alpha/beta hydrolase [Bacillus sp. S/N-304-OC-R1]MBY0121081.1 alpha/beta hydrolase [Bacillus sp. S/N-304-OC-R1]
MTEIMIKNVDLPNGETIFYRERSGGSQNVLLVHGNMNSSKHWDVVLERMDSKYKLYAIDQRGFGLSTYRQPIYSIKDLAYDLKSFIEAIGLKDFSIIGWSLGGTVCMQYVADNPQACEKMILLASGSTRGYPLYEIDEKGMPDLNRRVETYEQTKLEKAKVITTVEAYASKNRDFLRMVYDAVIYTKNKPNPERYEEYIDDMLTQRNYPEMLHALNTFNISGKFNGLMEGTGEGEKIKIPTLVLLGDRDLVISRQMNEEILEDIGENASFIELKDCGHSPLIDDLEQLLNVMSEFLDR